MALSLGQAFAKGPANRDVNQFCRNASLAKPEAHKLLLARSMCQHWHLLTHSTDHRQLRITCASLTHSSPNPKQGFGNSGVSHHTTFVLPLCSNHHRTRPVTGPTATPSTQSARYSTRLNLVLTASRSSLPHCRSTLQETEKQRSLPLCQGNSS